MCSSDLERFFLFQLFYRFGHSSRSWPARTVGRLVAPTPIVIATFTTTPLRRLRAFTYAGTTFSHASFATSTIVFLAGISVIIRVVGLPLLIIRPLRVVRLSLLIIRPLRVVGGPVRIIAILLCSPLIAIISIRNVSLIVRAVITPVWARCLSVCCHCCTCFLIT